MDMAMAGCAEAITWINTKNYQEIIKEIIKTPSAPLSSHYGACRFAAVKFKCVLCKGLYHLFCGGVVFNMSVFLISFVNVKNHMSGAVKARKMLYSLY
jgi:hypothetical protein